jgi:4-amino-4-deoxy-L-arabinose transferase-like glycosyltransferase
MPDSAAHTGAASVQRRPIVAARSAPLASDRPYASWATWRATLVLVLSVTALRILYLAFVCPYTLVEDEAHYWEWSRRLEWSYYSKGPGVAWAIAASTWLGRTLGLPLSEFWVRLPAALSGGLLLLGVAGLARAVFHDARAGFLAAVCILLIPAFQAASLLMTIDVPYAACWALAAWSAFAALHHGSRAAWPALGLCLGVGFLFKYTILLLVPGILIYAWIYRRDLAPAPAWRRLVIVAAAIFALGLLPVAIWNAQNGWPTLRHLLGHLGVAGGDVPLVSGGRAWNPAQFLEFLASQFALIGPMLVFMGWSVAHARRSARSAPAGSDFLIWCAVPILVFYLVVAVFADAEGNWPLAGYITLAALCGWGVLEAQRQWGELRETGKLSGHWLLGSAGTPARLAWRTAIVFGAAVAVASLRLDVIASSAPMALLNRVAGAGGLHNADRPLIPVGRLMGGRTVSLAAESLRQKIAAETGAEPFLIAQHYGRASQLAFYIPGHPTIYCSSARSDGRRTQYDLWPETSLDDPALRGRPAVCVGGHLYQWEPAFERTEEFGMLEGEPKASRLTFVGYGYKGFPAEGTPRE